MRKGKNFKFYKLLALLCAAILCLGAVGCNEKDVIRDTNESDTEQTDKETEQDVKLSSLSIDGVDISEYKIVYATSFTREQCFEDMKTAADMLNAELEAILGVTLNVAPDTADTTDKEIILGVATRLQCLRYYNASTKLERDDYCVMYSDGKLLLGADCLAGVVDACDVFINYLKTQAKEQKTAVDITDGFDLSGSKHITRVACVGDSTTEGIGANDEISESYPAQLQKNLGYDYDVVNYGKGGTTLCSYSHQNYTKLSYIEKSGYYSELLTTAPYTDIVIIMLGSNDGAGLPEVNELLQNNYNSFKTDFTLNLTKIVKDLREKNPDIEIMLFSCVTVRIESVKEENMTSFSGRKNNLVAYITPLQKELASSLSLDFFDMYDFTEKEITADEFTDGLHLTPEGYVKMAQRVTTLLKERYDFK